MLSLTDIGANLTHDSFDADRDEVIARAAAAGVSRLIITGSSVTSSVQAASLTNNSQLSLFSTAGVHPHHAKEFDAHSIEALHPLLTNSSVVAVGECGLDFFRDFSPRDMQEYAFSAQLELAAQVQLPVFMHQRDAHDRFVELLKQARGSIAGGVAHCFTGGREELHAYLDMDLYIGITGWVCDERRGHKLREALADIPLDRLLIETDAPYLLPRDLKPQPKTRRNEPVYLTHVLDRIAHERKQSLELIATASHDNATRLFGLPA